MKKMQNITPPSSKRTTKIYVYLGLSFSSILILLFVITSIRPDSTALQLNGSIRAADNDIPNSWEKYALAQGPSVYQTNPRFMEETLAGNLQVYTTTIQTGDSIGLLLEEWIGETELYVLLESTKTVYSLSRIRPGQPITIVCDRLSGEWIRLEYEVNKESIFTVEKSENIYIAELNPFEYDTQLVLVEGEIKSSLFEAITDSGESPVLAIALADVYGSEINFITEIRKGDTFRALVEKQYYKDELKGYGEIIAAEFVNNQNVYEAFLFADDSGNFQYYDNEGQSLQRLLLKVPLNFTRVSSAYTMNRIHPIFGDNRPHQGIDYAAPTGTPVVSVGDGTVKKVGWVGGFGNTVIIQHDNGFESQYAHLSRFANIKNGNRVKQGQTIAYVGSTGNSTGPHLDFRIKQNGRYINPSQLVVPRRDPITEERMEGFTQSKELAQLYFDNTMELAKYDAKMFDTITY